MWHWTNEDTGEIISGTREHIKYRLNIYMVGFDYDGEYIEEIAEIWNDRHWKQICKDYKIWGKD